jgi:hypothetical protein
MKLQNYPHAVSNPTHSHTNALEGKLVLSSRNMMWDPLSFHFLIGVRYELPLEVICPFRLNASRPRSVDDPCVGASRVHEHHASCVDTLHAQETLPVALWLCVSALLDSLMLLRVQELLVSTVSTLPVAAVLTLRASLLPVAADSSYQLWGDTVSG